MTVRIELTELQREGRRVRLDAQTAAALQGSRLVEVRPDTGGHYLLLPTGRVGAVTVGRSPAEIEVVVTPKTPIRSVLFLLGYARDPGFHPSDVSGLEDASLWPAVAETFARQAERALGQGVLQGYVTVDDTLPLVRGRIRVADQLARRPGHPLPLEVRFDEYSPDIPENRILRTAIRHLLAQPRLADSTRRRLTHLDGRLDGVSVLPDGRRLPVWRTSRANQRYQAVLRLAELLLADRSLQLGDQRRIPTAAFVVDMAKVFEDFLTVALQEALRRHPGHTVSQYPTHLDQPAPGHTPAIRMNPDVVHVVDGHPVAVFDAKYKREDASAGFPNADSYQMLAYCTALGLPRGWLVYAHGHSGQVVRRIRHTDIDIVESPLDLSRDPEAVLAQVAALAEAAVPTRANADPSPRASRPRTPA